MNKKTIKALARFAAPTFRDQMDLGDSLLEQAAEKGIVPEILRNADLSEETETAILDEIIQCLSRRVQAWRIGLLPKWFTKSPQ
jgi:hypothetical protein